jgi:HSP20 family protein
MDEKNIEVKVVNGTLTIKGEKQEEKEEKKRAAAAERAAEGAEGTPAPEID